MPIWNNESIDKIININIINLLTNIHIMVWIYFLWMLKCKYCIKKIINIYIKNINLTLYLNVIAEKILYPINK
jgi:hypothetical protein